MAHVMATRRDERTAAAHMATVHATVCAMADDLAAVAHEERRRAEMVLRRAELVMARVELRAARPGRQRTTENAGCANGPRSSGNTKNGYGATGWPDT